jgi:hypothetical protein
VLGRERECAELEAFCTAPEGSPAYLWWRAPAWAGKSALMWFVLYPPEEVRVVSFFVTARYAGQEDRIACAEVLIEQRAELLNEPLPPLLSEATREAHLLGMLARATAACREKGPTRAPTPQHRRVTAAGSAGGHAGGGAGRPNPPIPTDLSDHLEHRK